MTCWCAHEYKPTLGFEKKQLIFVFCFGQLAMLIFIVPAVSLAGPGVA
jgi:hypothetical protein